jgi:hypothetical protein
MYKSLSTLTNPFFCKNNAKSAEKLRFYAKKTRAARKNRAAQLISVGLQGIFTVGNLSHP